MFINAIPAQENDVMGQLFEFMSNWGIGNIYKINALCG